MRGLPHPDSLCRLRAKAAPASKYLMPGASPGFDACRDLGMDCDGSLSPRNLSMMPSPQIAVCSFVYAGTSVRIQHTAVCLMMVPWVIALQGSEQHRTCSQFRASSTLSELDVRRLRAAVGLRWKPETPKRLQLPHSRCCRVCASAGTQWQAAVES